MPVVTACVWLPAGNVNATTLSNKISPDGDSKTNLCSKVRPSGIGVSNDHIATIDQVNGALVVSPNKFLGYGTNLSEIQIRYDADQRHAPVRANNRLLAWSED